MSSLHASMSVNNHRHNRLFPGRKNARYTTSAETQIATKVTSDVVWAFQVQHAPLHEPFHFEADASVDKVVEVAICMF